MCFEFSKNKGKKITVRRNENVGVLTRVVLLLTVLILSVSGMPHVAFAEEGDMEDLLNKAEERKNNPVESNEIEGWPQGPKIGAEAAILMDADSGQIIYAKDIDEKLFPASTTKIMTCVVAMENTKLSDVVTINQSAIDANDTDGSNMGLFAGEKLTVDELIHGILISSANEACNAIAQHVSGDIDSYVELMNKKAAELGCTNTHFVTANGLANPEHYTSARDLATIGRAFFSYDFLCKTASTAMYEISESENHRAHSLYSKNKLYKGREFSYEYLIGSKTGFTSESRQTLVSCAEKDGIRLIAVILKEESPYQFQDTVELFEYGFNNFTKVNVASNETKYTLSHNDFFDSDGLMFGNNAPIISLDEDSYVLLPEGIEFSDLTSKITYSDNMGKYFGTVDYYYNDLYMGCAGIAFEDAEDKVSYVMKAPGEDVIVTDGNKAINETLDPKTKEKQIIIDIKKILLYILMTIVIVVAIIFAYIIAKKFIKSSKTVSNIKRRREIASRRRRAVWKNVNKSTKKADKHFKRNLDRGKYDSLNELKLKNDFMNSQYMKNSKSSKNSKEVRTLKSLNVSTDSKSSKVEKSKSETKNRTRRNDINFEDFEI